MSVLLEGISEKKDVVVQGNPFSCDDDKSLILDLWIWSRLD